MIGAAGTLGECSLLVLGALEALPGRVKTSIVQGIAVFLSLFETDPDVRRVFLSAKGTLCGRPCSADPQAQVLPPFDDLIESGKVVGLNFPVALNPAVARRWVR